MSYRTSLAALFEPVLAEPAHTHAVDARVSQGAFLIVSTLLFLASATITVLWCSSMSAMGAMPMPGGWTMSMAYMRMPGDTWAGTAASFIGMWVLMMIAMMLPSLVPMLSRYRRAIAWSDQRRLGWLTTLAGIGYYFVWTLFGVIAFALGVLAVGIEMEQSVVARFVPAATGVVVLLCGALQFTPWKSHHLLCCRQMPDQASRLPANSRTAWVQGLRFGFHCCYGCLNLTVILLVAGVMDLRAMAAVTAAITVERLAPGREHAARVIGTVVLLLGSLLTVRALAL